MGHLSVFHRIWLLFIKPAVAAQASRPRVFRPGQSGVPGWQSEPSAPASEPLSDEQLMVAHAAGDPAAFGELYQRYVQPLLRLMVRQQRFRDEAHDLVQQTFLQVHRARADYDPTRTFRPWLYAIARNLMRETLRRRMRRPTVAADAMRFSEPVAEGVGPEDIQVARAVRIAIEALPPDQREVIELHWFDGLTFQDIAQCLGVPANTAKVRAHRGYQRLRARLGDFVGGETGRLTPA